MPDITFRGTKSELMELATGLGEVLAGNAPDSLGIAKGLATVLGFAALSSIKDAFIIKSRGGTDEMGIKWPPLSPATIAARKVSREEEKSSPDIKDRQAVARREEKKRMRTLPPGMNPKEARAIARRYGQIKATRETGRKKIEVLGFRQVNILRDTGKMFNSLQPGRLNGSSYSPPTDEGGENQIFEATPGLVTVGTRDVKFPTHNFGRPAMKDKNGRTLPAIPRRQVFPDSNAEIPSQWWEAWAAVGNRYLEMQIGRHIQNG